MIFVRAWSITCLPGISVFMSAFFHKLEGNGQLARAAKIWPQLEANTQQIMDYYDSSLETAIDHDNYLEFQQVLSDIGEALEARFVLEDKLILLVLTPPASNILLEFCAVNA
ncbi:regulator of sigma D [Escherichia coli]|uniref:Regulator of sigma D n=1 Tax=Escherichia coli TaxID=562 RepID=A0A377D343_ECOLX|nr:regulator of sigma D [Escherichia coli]